MMLEVYVEVPNCVQCGQNMKVCHGMCFCSRWPEFSELVKTLPQPYADSCELEKSLQPAGRTANAARKPVQKIASSWTGRTGPNGICHTVHGSAKISSVDSTKKRLNRLDSIQSLNFPEGLSWLIKMNCFWIGKHGPSSSRVMLQQSSKSSHFRSTRTVYPLVI